MREPEATSVPAKATNSTVQAKPGLSRSNAPKTAETGLPPPSPTTPITSSSTVLSAENPNENQPPLSARRQLLIQQRRAQSNDSGRIPPYIPPFQVVYGANSVASEESARVMSEKVQMLASSIYKELEMMIKKYGEESVKELMPLVVNVLESLDTAYVDKDEHAVDVEMLKEENEQLLNQYERERQTRKQQDQKYLELEEVLTDQNRELEGKVEQLEGNIRVLELKARNANDHVARCEEREAELRTEYDKLHERYNDLIRTHIEHVERTKYLMGPDKFDMMQSLPSNHNRGGMAASVDVNVRGISDLISATHMTQSTHASVNLANHISMEKDFHDEFGQDTEDLLNSSRKDGQDAKEELEQAEGQPDTQRSEEEEPDDGLSAELTGMGREVDNLIKENTELLETKNALNVVKNDLIAQVDQLSSENEVLRDELNSMEISKAKNAEKIKELEQEIKTLKEKINEEQPDEQEDIPMAQRKRFTRVEMARVLMERNQYKEKLMELQEAVKYTEMQRVKKLNHQPSQSKGRIWDFFSGLFGETPVPTPSKRPQRSSSQVRKQRLTRTFDIDMDNVQEKRKSERRQQYKAVSQHMKKDDESRTRAYGWSIPVTSDNQTVQHVPVPVCCRPLLDQQPSLRIWCASGSVLYGGKNTDGEYIIGDSSFYSDPVKYMPSDPIQKKRLMEQWPIWESSSLVWICSSNEKRSYVTILDSNNPNCIVECFSVCTSHLLCISSVPGVREDDAQLEDAKETFVRQGGYLTNLLSDLGATDTFGQVHWVDLRSSEVDEVPTYCSVDEKASPKRSRDFSVSEVPADKQLEEGSESVVPKPVKRVGFEITGLNDTSARSKVTLLEKAALAQPESGPAPDAPKPTEPETAAEKDDGERNLAAYSSLPPHIRDALSKYEGMEEMTTALPTMWMGLENDFIVVHSGALEWRKCLMRIKMADAVLHILHYKGFVFAALANGTIAVFHRDQEGRWATDGYHIIRLGQASSSVCNMTVVEDKIWAAYRNCIVIIDPTDLTIETAFVAHPRKDSQVKHMAWAGEGVWVSIRLDSTIRLYHSQTLKHLQDVDIEPYLSTMLGSTKIDHLHLRITSLVVLNRKLWIGTGTGVIIAVPLSNEGSEKVEIDEKKSDVVSPGGLVRVYGNDKAKEDGFIPYCNISQAQFSFHGHKDSVRFFICVPADGVNSMTPSMETRKLLITSGGDGYIDFRLGEDEEATDEVRVRDMSHLIVWENDSPNPYQTQSP
ncbi:unnamed protein product [Bursaphelenchus xylophilus]|uniref:(pine wood nematode) hypothetical protein n=1 Tax=Bursaphelenchus xylophilus TaxID=6326 RepID=A0A1I7SQR8_BURXY|nr:unnamed protein product [Bursaphelenchus xylophilus]CAG9110292.1 unnamed protein product [Bursaphelenchus xylophilus]